MPDWDSILDDLQADAFARLESEDFFSDIVILEQRRGVLASEVETALTTLNQQSGKKIGACVIVQMAEIESGGGQGRRPDNAAILRIEVVTLPLINDSTDGTQKQAARIALNVRDSLHLYFSGLTRTTLHEAPRPITPVEEPEEGEVSYIVTMHADFSTGRRQKVATPSGSAADGELTLACATEDATIYVTTDGSYPGPANESAEIYTTPITLTEGLVIRAGAVKSGCCPSNTGYWQGGMTVLTDGDGAALTDGAGDFLGTGEIGLTED
jgi:hypothetical protein